MDDDLRHITSTIILIIYVMAYGLHGIMIGRIERSTRWRNTSRLHMTITLERGGYGVIKTPRVHPRRKSIISDGLFPDTILERGKGLIVT